MALLLFIVCRFLFPVQSPAQECAPRVRIALNQRVYTTGDTLNLSFVALGDASAADTSAFLGVRVPGIEEPLWFPDFEMSAAPRPFPLPAASPASQPLFSLQLDEALRLPAGAYTWVAGLQVPGAATQCEQSAPILFDPAFAAFRVQLNQATYRPGDELVVTLRSSAQVVDQPVDAYLAVQFPDRRTVLFYPDFLPEARPFMADVALQAEERELWRISLPEEVSLVGVFTWFAGLAQAGTLDVLGSVQVEEVELRASPLQPQPLQIVSMTSAPFTPELRVEFNRPPDAATILPNVGLTVGVASLPDFLRDAFPRTSLRQGEASRFFTLRVAGDGRTVIVTPKRDFLPSDDLGLLIIAPVTFEIFPGIRALDGGELAPQVLAPVNLSFEA